MLYSLQSHYKKKSLIFVHCSSYLVTLPWRQNVLFFFLLQSYETPLTKEKIVNKIVKTRGLLSKKVHSAKTMAQSGNWSSGSGSGSSTAQSRVLSTAPAQEERLLVSIHSISLSFSLSLSLSLSLYHLLWRTTSKLILLLLIDRNQFSFVLKKRNLNLL